MALSEEPPLEIEVTREQREREGEGRTKKEVVLALRNRNLSNLFHSLLRIFLLFSLSLSRLEPRFQGRQMMRVPRGDVVTSLVLPPFLYPPPCERHLFHPAVTRICNFLFVRPPIRLEDRFEEEFQSGAIFRFVSIA